MVAVLGVLFSVGTCAAAEKVRIRYLSWETSFEQIAMVKKLIAEFERRNPDIKISLESSADATRIFLTDAAAGTPPDVMYITTEFIAPLVEKRILEPLDPYIERDHIDMGMFIPSTIEGLKVGGGLYAYPIHFSVDLLFYNKRLFDERGVSYPDETWTWQTYRDAATSLTIDRNRDGQPEVFGCMQVDWQLIVKSFGGRIFDPKRYRFVNDSREALQAFAFNSSLQGKQAPSAAQAMDTTDMQLFSNGRVAMFVGRTWQLPQIIKTMRDPWDIAHVPKGKQRTCILNVGGNCIAAGSPHKEAAWKFVKFYSSPEGQRLLGVQKNCTPAVRELATSPDFFLSPPPPSLRVAVDAADYASGRLYPDDAWAPEFYARVWQTTVDQFRMTSPITPEAALARIVRAGNALIESHEREKAECGPVQPGADTTSFLIRLMLTLMAIGAMALLGLARTNRRYWEGYAFVAPWLVGFVLFTLGPVLASLYLSFCRYDLLTPPKWVGLRNIVELVTDPVFWISLKNTLYYSALVVPGTLVMSLGLAMLLNTGVRGTTFFRAVYYLPALTAGVATSLLWRWIFNPQLGLFNMFLNWVGLPGPEWLTSLRWAMPAIIIMSIWGGVAGPMLIYLAGLQGIPQHLYEAAAIDGASRWQMFRHVTLPMLSPTIFFNLIMAIIGSFQVFTTVFVMTANTAASQEPGGPANSTMVYVLYLYQTGFRYLAMGKACAMAWILFLIILGLTLWNYRMSQRWVHYDQA
ncbi:MAG: extracellular solute-binding protein [Candidatus Sumerlaeaceae bacterium]